MQLLRYIALMAWFSSMWLGAFAKVKNDKPQDLKKAGLEELKERLLGKDHTETVDKLREHHRNKMAQFEEMLIEKKGYLDDYKAGRIELTESDIEFYTRQVKALQERLDEEKDRSDEDHERLLQEKAKNLKKSRKLHIPHHDGSEL